MDAGTGTMLSTERTSLGRGRVLSALLPAAAVALAKATPGCSTREGCLLRGAAPASPLRCPSTPAVSCAGRGSGPSSRSCSGRRLPARRAERWRLRAVVAPCPPAAVPSSARPRLPAQPPGPAARPPRGARGRAGTSPLGAGRGGPCPPSGTRAARGAGPRWAVPARLGSALRGRTRSARPARPRPPMGSAARRRPGSRRQRGGSAGGPARP